MANSKDLSDGDLFYVYNKCMSYERIGDQLCSTYDGFKQLSVFVFIIHEGCKYWFYSAKHGICFRYNESFVEIIK